MAEIDRGLAEMVSLIESAEVNLQEAAQSLRRYGDRVELDPARLSTVEQRLDALHAAARRFRTRPESLPALLAETRQQLAALEAASDAQAMQQQELAAQQHYSALAQRLSAGRAKAATKFGREVTAAMKELALGGGRFEVSLQPIDGGAAQGNETVEFLVSANPGVEPRSLAKVASGGELSRISLAIQVIASAASAVPSMIFDEVDAGIGGAVAEVVGRKLSQLARSRQVLCVTHLPQVAALADQQWSVSKSGNGDSVQSKVTPLDAAARVEEIARMLGGVDITPTTRKHAKEMLAAHR
jgi:DNA repair protein RecN (Recombination protein N)